VRLIFFFAEWDLIWFGEQAFGLLRFDVHTVHSTCSLYFQWRWEVPVHPPGSSDSGVASHLMALGSESGAWSLPLGWGLEG